MLENPSCSVCGGSSWQPIGNVTYRRSTGETMSGWKRSAFRILFEVWAPGADAFSVKFQTCNHCGFVLYAPRPSADDVIKGFDFHDQIKQTSGKGIAYSPRRERLRARRLFSLVSPHLNDIKAASILDFGGNDGRLSLGFVEAGAQCDLLDYSGQAVTGVNLIGRNEDDLPPGKLYDAILCSHVVEHLPEPLAVVGRLVQALKPGGVMFIEVPVEMWRGPPRISEPVTHLNFFTPGSIGSLMSRAGLEVKLSKLTNYPHPHGGWRLVAKCIGINSGTSNKSVELRGAAEVNALLRPSPMMKLRRRLMLARGLPHTLKTKLFKT